MTISAVKYQNFVGCEEPLPSVSMAADDPRKAKREASREAARAVGIRLAQAMAEAHLSQNRVEKDGRFPSGYINKLTKGLLGQRVEPATFVKLPRLLRVNAAWLWLGEGSMRGEADIIGPDAPPRVIAREMARLLGLPTKAVDLVLEEFAGPEWDGMGPRWFCDIIDEEAQTHGVSRRREIRLAGDEKRRRVTAPPEAPASAKPERKRRAAGKR